MLSKVCPLSTLVTCGHLGVRGPDDGDDAPSWPEFQGALVALERQDAVTLGWEEKPKKKKKTNKSSKACHDALDGASADISGSLGAGL